MSLLAPALLLASAAAPVPREPARAVSLCTAGEVPLFSCPIRAKIVSVCSGGAGATYRYGRPGRVELSARAPTFARRGYAGGGEAQITATVGRHRYTVFDRTVRTAFGDDGRHDPASSSGLVVRDGDRTLMSATCGGDATISSKAETLLSPGIFLNP